MFYQETNEKLGQSLEQNNKLANQSMKLNPRKLNRQNLEDLMKLCIRILKIRVTEIYERKDNFLLSLEIQNFSSVLGATTFENLSPNET